MGTEVATEATDDMGLSLRVILIVTVPTVLVVGIHGFLRVRFEELAFLETERRGRMAAATAVQVGVEGALKERPIADLGVVVDEIVARHGQDLDRVRLFDRDLNLRVVSTPPSISSDVPVATLRRVRETSRPEDFFERRDGRLLHYVLVPVRDGAGQTQGVLEVVHRALEVDRLVAEANRDLWVRLGLLVLVLTAVTALVLQRQVVRPVRELLEGITRVGEGQTPGPLTTQRRDELGQVARAFNRMTEHLGTARQRLVEESERAIELERQLRRAAALTVMSKLASGIAHDVSTPLNVISARAEFALRALPVGHPSREDLEIILAQIDRIATAVRSLEDVARPLPLRRRSVLVADVVYRMLALVESTARRSGIRLAASVAPDVPPVLADANQLQQVLLSLLLNALEATPEGGRINVSARRLQRDGRFGVALAVTDTGSGIPPDNLPRIFEPFFTTRPSAEGFGLGLTVCREIVAAHGGELDVESREGAGTTFTVWLPDAEDLEP